jgi:hypothetical protein
MCPGGNGMRQLSIFLIIRRILLALMIFLLNSSFPRYNAIFSEISCVIFVSLHRLVISACLRICIDVCSTESCLMPNAALLFLGQEFAEGMLNVALLGRRGGKKKMLYNGQVIILSMCIIEVATISRRGCRN